MAAAIFVAGPEEAAARLHEARGGVPGRQEGSILDDSGIDKGIDRL